MFTLRFRLAPTVSYQLIVTTITMTAWIIMQKTWYILNDRWANFRPVPTGSFLQYTQQIRISPDLNHTACFWNFNYWTVWGSVPIACDMEELESEGHLSFQTTNPMYFHAGSFSDSFPRCINVRSVQQSVSLRDMRMYSFAIPSLQLLE